ncbi:Myo-inositol transporter-like protein [Elsinoe fawcettii]|nr:Myo-inositol transporter-like protein [Elsinoe fawcettii]
MAEKGDIHMEHHEDVSALKASDLDDSNLIAEMDSIEQTPVSRYVWLCTITCSCAGFLFGYDTGIISAVLVYLGTDLDGVIMSPQQKEAITALCSGGAFFGAIAAGLTADRFGRKGGIYVGCFLFTVGALIQAVSYSFAQMVVGRFIVGLGVGSAAMIAPLYIAEIAPTKYRGRMIGLNNMSITGGQVVSYGLGAGFAYVPNGWRYMVGLGGVPSVILACLLPFCPESPRQLIARGREEEAARVFQRVFKQASEEQVQNKIKLVKASMLEAEASSEGKSKRQLIKELHVNPRNFRALLVACGLMVISQMSGFNTLMYYSSTLFALVGFSNPTAVGLVVAGTNFIMAGVNGWIVDPWGRRKVLVTLSWGMSAALFSVAIAFHWIPVNTATLELTQKEVSPAAIVVLVFIILFVLFYSATVGNTAWMSTDFFAQDVRSVGTMFLTCSCWGSNVIVSSTFLTQMHSLTPSGTFGFYAAICFFGWVLLIFFYPEVSGLTIDETSQVFDQPLTKMVKPRIHIHVTASNRHVERDLLEIDVASDFTLADLKGYIQAETTFDPAHQQLYFDGRLLSDDQTTLDTVGLKDGDMLAVMIASEQETAQSSRQSARPSEAGSDRVAADIERQRVAWASNPGQLALVRNQAPDLAEVVHDPVQFRQRFEAKLADDRRKVQERERQMQILNEDPFNVEAQAKIEEMIRQENVMANLQYAHEHNPESFAAVTMLYIDAAINGHHIKVLVDSGAQMTVMSPSCAEACNIMRLIDTRYAGIARGVGTAKILGRVHSADLHIGSHFLPCSFMVMEGKSVDLLLGLDMLKKYQVNIDLKKNKLVLPNEEIDFLPESELPKNQEEERAEEPTIDGPNGTKIGTETGTIRPAASSSSASASNTSGNFRGTGQTIGQVPPYVQQTPSAPTGSAATSSPFPKESIEALVGMGMTRQEAINALQATDGNVDQAASFLFE